MSTLAEILTTEIRMFPGRFIFTIARGRAEFWKSFDAISWLNEMKMRILYHAMSKASSSAGFASTYWNTTQRSRVPPPLVAMRNCSNKLQGISWPLISSSFKKLTILSEKYKIKNVELGFCVMGHQSFNSLENEGLISLLQTFVNIASNVGCFNVKDVLFGRKTISDFSKQKVS